MKPADSCLPLSKASTGPHPGRPVGRLERLPKALNLVPMVLQWLWLSLRHRSLTLPSCANPAIATGGMVGEGKLEYLAAMGDHARRAMVPTTGFTCEGPSSVDMVEARMGQHGLAYPIVLKPDLGWCGFGVRRIDDRGELLAYLSRFPLGECIVMQPFLPQPGEAGVFYLRMPHEAKGRLIGLLLRHAPQVTGDGRHTVAELAAMDVRASRLGRDGASGVHGDPQAVPPAGERVRLSTVSSTRVGGLYENATALITPALTDAFDRIARDMASFHVGRFDVKFDSLASLCEGHGFQIIEVNGAGSEAVHAWDPALGLRAAYRIIFDKQRRLFDVGAAMRRLGHRPIGPVGLARAYLRQMALIKRYPPSN